MTAIHWLMIAGLVLVPLGGVLGIIRWFAERDRAALDQALKAANEDIDELRADLSTAEKDLAILREQIKNLPDKDLLYQRFADMENKIDVKLETLTARLSEIMTKFAEGFRCPLAGKAN